jgi:hypothetical protein
LQNGNLGEYTMRIWLNLFTNPQFKGFTLLELLIASVMSFFVVSATGFAILVMTRQSLVTDVSSDLTFNTNRASDFIADEIKQANSLSINSGVLPTGCTLSGNDQFVIRLVIDGAPNDIIYYTKTPSGNDWRGPSSIYRCGPNLTGTGGYGATQEHILVDSISTDATARADNCSTGTQFPNSPAAGFYICVNDVGTDLSLNQPAEKLIEMHITASSSDLADRGLGREGNSASSGTYATTTNIYARSATSDFVPFSEEGLASLAVSSGSCTSLTVTSDGGTPVTFSDGMGIISETSLVIGSLSPTSGPNSNQITYSDGSCSIIATFTAP